MLLGPGGVGKTSLKRGLMGLKYDQRMNSTIVAEVMSVTPVSGTNGNEGETGTSLEEVEVMASSEEGATPLERKWITDDWREVTDEDEIDELARLIANVKEDETASIAKPSQAQGSTTSSATPSGYSKEYTSTIRVLMNSKILDEAFRRAKAMKSSTNPEPSPFYHVWDCGGQPVFQEVLPVFLTARTMFLLLFNAKNDLKEYIELLHYRQGQEIREEGFFNLTTLELLEGWMSNIHSYLLKTDEYGAYLEYPRVIPIGTRGDQLSESEKKDVKDKLVRFLEDKAFRKVLKHPVIIDNTTAGTDKESEDPAYSEIREIIFEFATKRLVEVTPITWIIFRKVLNLLANRFSDVARNTITLEEAKAIATICKVDPDDVEHVLKFYHELGVLLYYPYIKGLENTIILNPKWFVECLGMILTLPGIGKVEEFERKKEWELLRTKGILVQPLYAAVWKDCEGVNPSNLIDLLAKFQLAVEVKTDLYDDPNPNCKQYFVPAVLQYAPQDDLLRETINKSVFAAPLHITFRSGYVIPGFFSRFVTRMADSKYCKLHFDEGIYHNRVTFKFLHCNLITLTNTAEVIEIAVRRLDNPYSAAELHEDCLKLKEYCEECCESVEDCLQPDNDEEMATASNFKIGREIKIVCQHQECPSDEVHYLEFNPSKRTVCCSKNNTQYRNISAKEACWFEPQFSFRGGIINGKDKPDPLTVYGLLREKHGKWNEIGNELGVALNYREELKKDVSRSESDKLEKVIYKWVETQSTEVTWRNLVDILKRLQLNDVAEEITKHLPSDTAGPSNSNNCSVSNNDNCSSSSSSGAEYFDAPEYSDNQETQLQ